MVIEKPFTNFHANLQGNDQSIAEVNQQDNNK